MGGREPRPTGRKKSHHSSPPKFARDSEGVAASSVQVRSSCRCPCQPPHMATSRQHPPHLATSRWRCRCYQRTAGHRRQLTVRGGRRQIWNLRAPCAPLHADERGRTQMHGSPAHAWASRRARPCRVASRSHRQELSEAGLCEAHECTLLLVALRRRISEGRAAAIAPRRGCVAHGKRDAAKVAPGW